MILTIASSCLVALVAATDLDGVAVTSIIPPYGSVEGGTDVKLTVSGISQSHVVNQTEEDHRLMCMFGGSDMNTTEVTATWVDDETLSCTTPATLTEGEVPVAIKIGDDSSASIATFVYHPDPVVISVSPPSLPAAK